MKGQYLAVETVFTFGLGLMVAIGVIVLFDDYRSGVMSSAEPEQVVMIRSEVLLAMDALREVDEEGSGSGSYQVDLPDNVAGSRYSLNLGNSLRVNVGSEVYELDLTGYDDYNLDGGAPGGDITIFKRGNNFTLRAQ